MNIKSLLFSGPKNIRRRLFRDIIIIILMSISAITALVTYQGKKIKDEVSAQLIGEASGLIRNRFVNFFSPVETSLQLIAAVVASTGLDHGDDSAVQKLLVPFLEVFKDVRYITIIEEHGEVFELERLDGNYDYRRVTDTRNNAPFVSAAYHGALAAPPEKPVFWSTRYAPHSSSSGLIASIKVRDAEDQAPLVVSCFISSLEIIKFISNIEIHQNIDIILFNQQKQLVTSTAADGKNNTSEISAHVTTRASRLDVAQQALAQWGQHAAEQGSRKLSVEGTTWWVGYTKLGAFADNTWLAIMVPDAAILKNVYREWLELAMISTVVLLIAGILTVNLVRKYAFLLKDLPQQGISTADLTSSIDTLIRAGESTSVEFKSTLRKNVITGKSGKEIEIAWLKTVVAFMNSDGGILLIGVSDDGQLIGTAADEFENEDKCRLHFRNCINTHIGTEYSKYVHLKICQINQKKILVIECERVRKPVFLRVGKTEDFFMRSGPSSMKLSMSQMITYLAQR